MMAGTRLPHSTHNQIAYNIRCQIIGQDELSMIYNLNQVVTMVTEIQRKSTCNNHSNKIQLTQTCGVTMVTEISGQHGVQVHASILRWSVLPILCDRDILVHITNSRHRCYVLIIIRTGTSSSHTQYNVTNNSYHKRSARTIWILNTVAPVISNIPSFSTLKMIMNNMGVHYKLFSM